MNSFSINLEEYWIHMTKYRPDPENPTYYSINISNDKLIRAANKRIRVQCIAHISNERNSSERSRVCSRVLFCETRKYVLVFMRLISVIF